jgi:hypothetical protein
MSDPRLGITQTFSRAAGKVADNTLARIKAFLADINSTNWIIVTGTFVGALTAVVYLTGIMLEKHPEPVTFGMWLSFSAAWIGFGVKQFRVKRETHIQGGPQDAPPGATS